MFGRTEPAACPPTLSLDGEKTAANVDIVDYEANLAILSPVDDHGRYTDECGLPDLVGKYVFDANRDVKAICPSA